MVVNTTLMGNHVNLNYVNVGKISIFQCLKMFLDQRRKDDPALAYEYFVYAFEGYLSLKMSSHIDRIQTFL